eukprot:NODE_2458_length_535_cov_164.166667_g1953_i0.p1 GENE.NODE_2458_length_535_cov_164.166667_g1953_i0~~NODE_2458_length_535_cov_164.166667_g1953_i0.p1  ORF type:complete len:138 (-),score=4.16 NODE_2458_length_535_cov_164.166667_g1953_i0:94-507(-)
MGYINLFPILTGLVTNSSQVQSFVSKIQHLMTGKGLTSLRKGDREKVGRSENYWTGPIWMNINYMMLRALYTRYMDVPGVPELYNRLRTDLIDNVHSEFLRTGKLWENYHPDTGEGQGTAPFTGWTILINLIMAETY